MSEAPRGQAAPGAMRAVIIFIALYVLSLLDRQVLTLMVDPIKRDLGVSDFQIGVLQGLAFALFYTIAGLPIGWLVDRFSRRSIIFAGVVVWALSAAACGLARNYWHLLIARLGVGAGEAALAPASYSMLADLFPKERLAFAMSMLLIGAAIGNGLAVAIGGSVVTWAENGGALSLPLIGLVQSWQFVFLVTGLPGVLLAFLAFLIREPQRRDRIAKPGERMPLSRTFAFMAENRRFFASHFIGFGLVAIMGYAYVSWIPTYMQRAFGLTIGEITAPLALVHSVGAAVGILASGRIVDAMYASGKTDAHLRYHAPIAILIGVVGAGSFFTQSPVLFLIAAALVIPMVTIAGIAAAALQIVTPNEMRGQVSAMFLVVMNAVGLGLGPVIVGALTDFVFRDASAVGASIALTLAICAPLAALAFVVGCGPMRRAVDAAKAWSAPT